MGILDKMNFRALDGSFNTIAILDAYESIIWSERYDEVGDFELHGPICDQMLQINEQASYIFNSATSSLMVVEKPDTAFDNEDGDTLTISGRAMESILDRRVLQKSSTILNPIDPRISQIICNLINDNIGSFASVYRKWDGLQVINATAPNSIQLPSGTGLQFTMGDNLLDTVVNLCQSFGLGFKTEFSPIDKITKFIIYEGLDRTQQGPNLVVFSDSYDNLASAKEHLDYTPFKTTMLVVGNLQDNTKNQPKFPQVIGNGVTGLSRRETFFKANVDPVIHNANNTETAMTDAQYIAAITQAGNAELSKPSSYMPTRAYDGEIIETETCQYGINFNLGDIVVFLAPHSQYAIARLGSVTLSDDANEGKTLVPEFNFT